VMQWFADSVMLTVGLNMAIQRIFNLGDATSPTDALNQRSGDARYLQPFGADQRYLQLAGGTLTGTLITPRGTGVNNLGLGIGDNTNGFYSTGNQLSLMAGSYPLAVFDGDARGLLFSGPLSMGGNRISVVADPAAATDAATKGYVDSAVSGITAPSALRTVAYLPNEVTLSSAAQTFLDINFTMPATGLRNILVTINPAYASNDPAGAQPWQVIYATGLIAYESSVVAYKFTADPTSMVRSIAQFTAVVDATPGQVRVLLSARLVGAVGALVQVGVGGTIAPNQRTVVTVQDLGPVGAEEEAAAA
jgi:hypothetical protein